MKIKQYIFGAVASAMALSLSARDDNATWLSDIADGVYIDQLSLPGAHDAATGNGTTLDAYARTQDLTLTDQFEAGIRVFDLRPSVQDGELKIYHGVVPTNLTFAQAIDDIARCLEEYPSEFAIVIMRHEDDHESSANKEKWADMMNDYLTDQDRSELFVEFSKLLTVREMRGKILVLSRDKYANRPVGAFIGGWNHESDFDKQKGGNITGKTPRLGAKLYVQDFYETSNALDRKEAAIRNMFDFSKTLHTRNMATWVINHTSGYSSSVGFATADAYRINAEVTNTSAADYIDSAIEPGPTGMMLMDFAGVDESNGYQVGGLKLINTIIDNNHRYTMRHDNSSIESIGLGLEANKDGAITVSGGEVLAEGCFIQIYSIAGQIVASGYSRAGVSAPGIYVVRAGDSIVRVAIAAL